MTRSLSLTGTPIINPNFQIAPGLSVSQAAFNTRVLGRALQSVPPYALGYNPYAGTMLNSYSNGMYPQTYRRSMYSSGDQNTSGYNTRTPATYPAEGRANSSGAFEGLVNSGGKVDWPLALRILPPSLETTPMRERIDGLVQQVQTESSKGKVDPALVNEAAAELTRLRERLTDKADFLPVSQQATADARQFVRRLQSALQSLE